MRHAIEFTVIKFTMCVLFRINGLYIWVPDILNRVLMGDSEGATACDVIAQRLNTVRIILTVFNEILIGMNIMCILK